MPPYHVRLSPASISDVTTGRVFYQFGALPERQLKCTWLTSPVEVTLREDGAFAYSIH